MNNARERFPTNSFENKDILPQDSEWSSQLSQFGKGVELKNLSLYAEVGPYIEGCDTAYTHPLDDGQTLLIAQNKTTGATRFCMGKPGNMSFMNSVKDQQGNVVLSEGAGAPRYSLRFPSNQKGPQITLMG